MADRDCAYSIAPSGNAAESPRRECNARPGGPAAQRGRRNTLAMEPKGKSTKPASPLFGIPSIAGYTTCPHTSSRMQSSDRHGPYPASARSSAARPRKPRPLHCLEKGPRNLIGIQECVDSKLLGQQDVGRSSLARAVGAAKNEDVLHFGRQRLIPLAYSAIKAYAGCNCFLPPFLAAFSTTGPWVSAVGGGGASPMRFE